MKRILTPTSLLALLLSSSSLFAQEQEKDVIVEKRIEKGGDNQEIVIRKKGDKDTKVTIEIKDGKVTINGKPAEDFNDENATVIIRKGGPRVVVGQPGRFRSQGGAGNFEEFDIITEPFGAPGMPPMSGLRGVPSAENLYFSGPMNKALLGVTSEGKNGGASVMNVTPNSGADKAGLKKGDVITNINNDEIKSPADLTEAIGKYKPEEKVNITYKRDGKTQKTTATLGKNTQTITTRGFAISPDHNMAEGFREFNFDSNEFPRLAMGRPRLGIKAQDTEDGKGVKVLEVADDSQAAKAGIKKDDIITKFNGAAINSTDDLMEAADEAREKNNISVELLRNGSTQTLEIKIPKKLKTANL